MTDLDTLLTRVPLPVADLTRLVTEWLVAERPEMTARVRPGWGTINFHHPQAGFVLAVYPRKEHVSVLFQRGRLLSSPLLVGDTKAVRWIELRPGAPIPKNEIGILIVEAIALHA